MTEKTLDWEEKADDVFTYLHQGRRAFSPAKMLALVDKMAVNGTVKQTELMEGDFSEDFIATTLSNVTTAVHGRGTVPNDDK